MPPQGDVADRRYMPERLCTVSTAFSAHSDENINLPLRDGGRLRLGHVVLVQLGKCTLQAEQIQMTSRVVP